MIKSDKKLNGKWVFSKAKIYNPFKEKYLKGNILINNGKFIELIGNDIPSDASVVDCSKKFITHPFIDLHAHFREPGREDKETLFTGAQAALSGGFTRVCIMPNTNPPLDSPESIRFIVEKAADLPIHIFPIGAITHRQEGLEITEIGENYREAPRNGSKEEKKGRNGTRNVFTRYFLQ